ncbi:MAG: AMP-binding protein [Candidatus Korobacteraceae bacterium]
MFDVGRTLIAAAARNGRALAVVDGDKRYTYRELLDVACRLVTAFDQLGIHRGDRLVVIMQNRAEMAIIHWAAQLAGVIVTPVNWRASAIELSYFLDDSGAKAVIYEPVSESAVNASTHARRIPRIGIGDAAGCDIGFEALMSCSSAIDIPRASPTDTSVMLYTSGTTGPGKGVPRRHHAERAAAIAHVAQNAYLTGEITLGVMPLYHTMGVRSLLAMAVINGIFVCLPRFDAGAALRLIASEGISTLYLVPTLFHDLLSHPDFPNTDMSSVRKIGFAGAAMTDGLLKRLNEALCPELFVNHYGSTEVYTFTIEQNAPGKPGSAGKAGINTEIRVIKLDSIDPDNVVRADEEGQIIATLSGDEAFEGYWQRPQADAKALHGGWYFTGDIGHFDEDGDLFVTGRVDDMMITGGENVLPAEIESVLSLHPAVAEIAVAGLPDERWGHQVTAFVRRTGTVSKEELDQWCRRSSLANFKRPRAYVFVDAIPKSPVGKILRRQLVQGDYSLELNSDEGQVLTRRKHNQ